MARRVPAVLLAIAALGVAPAAAGAQTNPFEPIAPAAPATPTPEPVDTSPADEDVGSATLYLIAGGILLAFVAIGVWIARDARKAIPARERAHLGELRDQGPHRHARQTKAKQRDRARAARAARKKNRPRT